MILQIDSAVRLLMRLAFIVLLIGSLYKNHFINKEKDYKLSIFYLGIYTSAYVLSFIPFLWLLMMVLIIFIFI